MKHHWNLNVALVVAEPSLLGKFFSLVQVSTKSGKG